MKRNLYTLNNWLNGKICPNPTFIKKDNKNKNHSFPWELFPKTDLKKIRETQKAIFNEEVDDILNNYINIFESFYKKSNEKKVLIQQHLDKLNEVLYSTERSQQEIVMMNNSDMIFHQNDLIELRFYIQKTYIEKDDNFVCYSIIHSKKCSFFSSNKTYPYIMGEALYRLHKHILSYHTEKIDLVFLNDYGENFFSDLVAAIVREKTKLADYSFLFYKLKEDKQIVRDTSHRSYLDYINENFNIKITSEIRQLNKKTTQKKEDIYNKIKEKYTKTAS